MSETTALPSADELLTGISKHAHGSVDGLEDSRAVAATRFSRRLGRRAPGRGGDAAARRALRLSALRRPIRTFDVVGW